MLYLKVSADNIIDAPMWFHLKGLSFTSSGYGKKIPTPNKLRHNDREYRIYCCIYSNSGTSYIVIKCVPHYLDVYSSDSEV